MARPFSPERHYDLIGRVERRNFRLAAKAEGDEAVALKKASKAAVAVHNYIEAKQYGQAIAYMKKQGEKFIEQLPETFETLQNQVELAKAKKAKKKAA